MLPSKAAGSAQPMGKPVPFLLLNLCGIVGVELPARNKGMRGTLTAFYETFLLQPCAGGRPVAKDLICKFNPGPAAAPAAAAAAAPPPPAAAAAAAAAAPAAASAGQQDEEQEPATTPAKRGKGSCSRAWRNG